MGLGNKAKVQTIARKIILFFIGGLLLACLAGCKGHLVGVLDPRGFIAYEERKLFFDSLALMLIVVLPVIVMSIAFVYHYQLSHKIQDYKPNWSHSFFLESLWWGIPCIIIVILAILTWKKSHSLDPYQPIPGQAAAPLQIQAIALPWKWLFIYPEQNIATLNYLVLPLNQQAEFWFTVDNVPMSAFFVPQLGSQIYAMAGMRTRLHLIANVAGTYEGMNTQFNGDGFSDMHFSVQVLQPDAFKAWVDNTKQAELKLTADTYKQLVNPSMNDSPKVYADVVPGLFQSVIDLYMNSNGTVHPRNDALKVSYDLK
jgi:cytochrome o ubiquinol oxidase subunit 2